MKRNSVIHQQLKFVITWSTVSGQKKKRLLKNVTTNRNNRLEVFYKKSVLRNFAKFIEKHLCQNLFIKVLKKKLWHRCFPVNFAKFLKTSFLPEPFRQVFLNKKAIAQQFSKVKTIDRNELLKEKNMMKKHKTKLHQY